MQIAVALLLTALLLYFVVDLREVVQVISNVDPWWALVTLLVITGDRALMSYKWGLLLRVRGHRVGVFHAMMVYCTAMIWGIALPSTVGADAIRAALIRRRGVDYNDSVATILVERGVGFVCALGMGLLSLATLSYLMPAAGHFSLLLAAGAAAMLGALVVLVVSFTERAFDIFRAMVPRRWHGARLVARLESLHDTYRSLATDRRTLAVFTALTCLQQLYLIGVIWLIAGSLSIAVNPLYFLAAAPLAFLASRLPVSFDGIGVYEAIFVGVMTLAGLSPSESFAIAICGRLYNLAAWLPWFLGFVFSGGTATLGPLKAMESQAATKQL